MALNRLLNLIMRVTTLGTRFFFIFMLAKYLTPADIGYYGLFTAGIGYAIFFTGIDFYTYSNREVVGAKSHQRGQMLKGQIGLSLMLYVIVLPVIYAAITTLGWPKTLVSWFIPILILEHINQEIFRLLTILSKQLSAGLALLLRHGSWALGVIAIMRLDPESRNHETIFTAWTIAGIATLVFGLWALRREKFRGWDKAIDWHWVKRGVKSSLAFLVGTLATSSLLTFDRYWLEVLTDIGFVGTYVLFIGITSTLMTILDAGVMAFAYPQFVGLFTNGDYAQMRQKVRRAFLEACAVCAAFAVIGNALLPYLLAWINKAAYLQNAYLFPYILSAMTLNALSLAPHFGLYAMREDRKIIGSQLAALCSFIVSTAFLARLNPILAIPIGLNCAFLTLFILRSAFYMYTARKLKGRQKAPE